MLKLLKQNTSGILSLILTAAILVFTFGLSHPVRSAGTATLALSPTSTTVRLNQTFVVSINLNTGGGPIDGVDIYSLHFNPAVLQVVDSDTNTAGVQIASTSLLPITNYNTVNNTTGTIQFSQQTSGGTNFNGSGVLASITFMAVGGGNSNVTFDFTAGSTIDSNVTYQGSDQLASVTNGAYTVDAQAPTVSISGPAGGSTVTGTVTVSATATDNIGVAGVQFKLDGSNLGSEDTSSPYSISWNTSTSTSGAHTLTAVARDAAGNTTTSAGVNVTVQQFDFSISNGGAKSVTQGSSVTNSITSTLTGGNTQAVSFSASGLPSGVTAAFSPTSCSPSCSSTLTLTASSTASVTTSTVTVTAAAGSTSHTTSFTLTVQSASYTRTISVASLEALSTKAVSGTIDVLNLSKTLLKSYSFTTDATTGAATISFDVSPQSVYLKIKASPFLTRLIQVDLNNNVTYAFPQLLTGDLNQDDIINSIDYSALNIKWFTNDPTVDLNKDGLINSIDYSYMNQHWLVTGEQ